MGVEPSGRLPGARERQLAETMAEVAAQLHGHRSRKDTVRSIVAAAAVTVPGASTAGVSLVQGREITSDAASSEIAEKMDALQVELDQGPCLSSLRHEHTVRIDDMATETRWPVFAARAAALGVGSTLSLQMYVREDDDAFGALNFYAERPHAFDEHAAVIGHLFARHAAVAYAEATRYHHLGIALDNRDLIGQAKGILMHREHVDAEAAFDMLSRASQETNIKLVDVARWLVDRTTHTAGRE